MPTIILQLDPAQLTNPDTDLRYVLPNLLISLSQGLLTDDGYDYINNHLLIFLQTQSPNTALPQILSFLASNRVLSNDLSQIPVALDDGQTITIHHPPAFPGKFHYPPPGNFNPQS